MTVPQTHSFQTPTVPKNQGLSKKTPVYYGTALNRFLIWIYNLRMNDPVDEIFLSADDINAVFRCLLYPPDMAVLWAISFSGIFGHSVWHDFWRKKKLSVILHDSRGALGPSCFCWGLWRCLYRTFGNHHLVHTAHSSQSRSNDARHY